MNLGLGAGEPRFLARQRLPPVDCVKGRHRAGAKLESRLKWSPEMGLTHIGTELGHVGPVPIDQSFKQSKTRELVPGYSGHLHTVFRLRLCVLCLGVPDQFV